MQILCFKFSWFLCKRCWYGNISKVEAFFVSLETKYKHWIQSISFRSHQKRYLHVRCLLLRLKYKLWEINKNLHTNIESEIMFKIRNSSQLSSYRCYIQPIRKQVFKAWTTFESLEKLSHLGFSIVQAFNIVDAISEIRHT